MITLDKIKYKKTEEKPCSVTLSVQIPSGILTEKQEQVTLEFQKAAQLPGFRAGKAPIDLIRKNFENRVKARAMEDVLREIVPQILKEKSLSPITAPTVDQLKYNNDQSISFNLLVEFNPQFKVKSYTKISIKKKVKKITDEDTAKELEQLRERNAQLVPSKSEKAEKNHFAVIDYAAFLDGQPLADLKAENQLIDLSAPQTIQGFAEGILGASRGETKDVSIQFPAEYPNKKIAGKSVTFKVTLRDLKEKVLPGLDDEFAKDLGLTSIAELKSKIMESLKKIAEKNMDADAEKQILDTLIEENQIPLPNAVVSMQLNAMADRALYEAYGAKIEKEPKENFQEKRKPFEEKLKPEAERVVRISYLLNGIAKQENLYATSEDLNDEKEKAKQTRPDQIQAIERYFKEREERILNQLTENKVLKFLKDHAKIKEITD